MIYAISDIHGYYEELIEKMELTDLSGDNRIVFCGDYINYGPKSGQVLKYIYDLQKKYGKDKVIVIKGNNDDVMLHWLSEYGAKNRKYNDPFGIIYDAWLESDIKQGYKIFGTLVSEEKLKELLEIQKNNSFREVNFRAVEMLLSSAGDLISWLRNLPVYYETDTQIFVHAGVNEGAGAQWRWSGTENMLWQYPHTTGSFIKTVIAGHVGTSSISGNPDFHDIYYDGESHYYIDGTVYKGGKLLLLGYDETEDKYYQIEKDKKILVEKYTD